MRYLISLVLVVFGGFLVMVVVGCIVIWLSCGYSIGVVIFDGCVLGTGLFCSHVNKLV